MASTEETRQAIELKILSPSSEVGTGGLRFENVSINETVGQLKGRIREVLPSRPGNERQRLIYLGRALVRDSDTLLEIFGANTIQEQQLHTLHLVLRESHSHLPSPTSAPRPASVPPGNAPANLASSTGGQQPHSTGPTPTSRNPFRAPQSTPPPVQQPQPQPIPNPLAQILGNAQIRATANGVPVSLPPEVINQLLNQHFQQHGQVPNLMTTIQQHQQNLNHQRQQQQANSNRLHMMEQQRDRIPAHLEQERQQLDQAIAGLREQINNAPEPQQQPNGAETGRNGGDGSPVGQQVDDPGESVNEAPEQPPNPPSTTSEPAPSPPIQVPELPPPGTGDPQPAALNQPHTVTRSGVNPDGSRWTMNMTTIVAGDHQHQHHQHPHPHGVPNFATPQFPQHQLGFPAFAQAQLPPQMPFPFPHMQHPGAHPRIGTPPAGLRPVGTPRSVSPARSISEGQHRAATPAAELQNHLANIRGGIENVNRLLGARSTGAMASGEAAATLAEMSEERRQQIRNHINSMLRNIDGFGADFNLLANALHPSVRIEPEFASLQSLYQAVHAQGRVLQQRVQDMTADRTFQVPYSSRQIPQAASSTTPALSSLPNGAQSTSTTIPLTRTVDSLFPTPPRTPELHLLTDPSGTPQALVVGPTGNFSTGMLPPEIMYGLLAAQLPHDRLVQEFSQIMREALVPTNQLAHNQIHEPAVGLPNLPGNAAFQDLFQAQDGHPGEVRERAAQLHQQQLQHQPGQQPVVAQQAANGNVAAAQQQGAAAPAVNNEVRDIIEPIVRNLWVVIRVLGFAYFFIASGRGYGRLSILAGLALIAYALNMGMFNQYVEGIWERLRRHFEALVNGPQLPPPPPPQIDGNGEGPSGTQGRAAPDPQDTARRLIEQQQAQNRGWVRDHVRQVERTIALFVASLWPGVGENLVQAQERARREEQERREAEEAKRKEEEEAKKTKEAEGLETKNAPSEPIIIPSGSAATVAASGASTGGDGTDGVNRVNKGKAKATEEEAGKQEGAATSLS